MKASTVVDEAPELTHGRTTKVNSKNRFDMFNWCFDDGMVWTSAELPESARESVAHAHRRLL